MRKTIPDTLGICYLCFEPVWADQSYIFVEGGRPVHKICYLRQPTLTREEIKAAARRWYGKIPVQQIAEILGVTRQTVQNWVADIVKENEMNKQYEIKGIH